MNHVEYNGWWNYETWVVNLWMDNEQGSQEFFLELAQAAYDESSAQQWKSVTTLTREESATSALEDQIKSHFEETQPELGASVWADLLGAAMSEVNWHEIASHLIDDVEKESGSNAEVQS